MHPARLLPPRASDWQFGQAESSCIALQAALKKAGIKVGAPVKKAILVALSERDPNADICLDAKGDPEPDAELRDTEIVALPDDIALDGNEDIFVRLMNDEAFKSIAASHLMRAVYQQVRASVGERETSLK
jgi:hypothetical protein